MMNFSTNQVMQFYVLDGTTTPSKVDYIDGGVAVKLTKADGQIATTDKIDNVKFGKLTAAAALNMPLKSATVTVSTVVEGANYALRVKYPEVYGLGLEGWTTKTAVYTCKSGDTASKIAENLAAQLSVSLEADGILAASATGAVITIICNNPVANWKRGVRPTVLPSFEVSISPVVKDDKTLVDDWAAIAESTSGIVNGSYKLADMEYFAMGERGDQYRYADYLNALDTVYGITPSASAAYNVLVVHYSTKGANQNSHDSEKDLIIVSTNYSHLETIADAIKTACGGAFTEIDGSFKETAFVKS